MELRHLRYFIAVAELRNMRAASEQLHVTQPAISRQIHDLEETLGVTLFERTPRGLALTPAGAAYLVQARDVLGRVDDAARVAQRVAAGMQGRLRLAFVENATWSGPVPVALHAFQRAWPQVGLELLPMNTPEMLEAIGAGHIDGGFGYRFGPLPQGCESVPLVDYDVVLAAPEAWPLARLENAAAHQLAGLPFVTFPRRVYPVYHDRLLDACARRGLKLNIVQEISSETGILSLVSAGVGAAIVNSANRHRPPSLVRLIPLQDISVPLPLTFFFAGGANNPALVRFTEQLVS